METLIPLVIGCTALFGLINLFAILSHTPANQSQNQQLPPLSATGQNTNAQDALIGESQRPNKAPKGALPHAA